MTGARQRLRLPQESRFDAACRFESAETVNISPLLAAIVFRRLATLDELATIYSYTDALNLAEIIVVNNYNTWAAASERGGHRR